MTGTPKFSVIIPTYNRADLLDRCLDSLARQSFKEFEVLVCDDGSTDDSQAVAELYKDRLALRYLWDENWGGPARPRNRGIAEAQGEWICFLDSDDWWTPDKLAACLPYLADNDLVYHDLTFYYQSTGKTGKIMHGRQIEDFSISGLLCRPNPIANSSVAVRRSVAEVVGPLSEDKTLVAVEDFDYWIRVMQHTQRVRHIPQALGYYYIGQNVSASLRQIDRMQALLSKYTSQIESHLLHRIVSRFEYDYARLYHLHNRLPEARRAYLRALGNRTCRHKALAGWLLALLGIKV